MGVRMFSVEVTRPDGAVAHYEFFTNGTAARKAANGAAFALGAPHAVWFDTPKGNFAVTAHNTKAGRVTFVGQTYP